MTYDARTLNTIDRWASLHSAPDAPALVTGLGIFSPRQIVQAIKNDTPVGKLIIRLIFHNTEGLPLEEVLNRIGENRHPKPSVTK